MAFLPIAITLPLVCFFLWLANWLLIRRHAELGNERKFPRQLIMLGLVIAGIVAVAMALPASVSTRNQVIAFLGLVVSGIFAFSSTTIFANLMAGIMMRITRPFRAGDFIKVKDVFGRVSERGLLDTEIQTETRQLIAVPNIFLINNPVSVIRSSGTIVSASISLGYDVNHATLEPLLKEAAKASGLEDPYVHVSELGDFSVTYKVNGMLKDVKSLLTSRSRLLTSVLDTLHREGIEIVSPNFMNQRPLKDGQEFIPQVIQTTQPEPEAKAEEMVFDKAEEAEKREREQLRLQGEIDDLESKLKEADGEQERSSLEGKISAAKDLLSGLLNTDSSEEDSS